MRKYVLAAIAALSFSTSAYASDGFVEPDGDPGSCVFFQAKNQGVGSVEVASLCNTVGGPVYTLETEHLYIESTKFTDLMDAKADSSALDALQTYVEGLPSQVNSDWNASSGNSEILNKPTLFSGAYSDLTSKPSLFSGSYTDLSNKPTISNISTGSAIVDTVTTGATDAATNANTSQVTNYNLLSGVLGLADGLNAANTAQNDLATKYNALATKYNDLATKTNANMVKVNTLINELEARTVPAAN